MSTKGSWKRPYNDSAWGSNFERIFGKAKKPLTVTVPADLPADDSWGVAERSIAASSNLATGAASEASHSVGSNPTAPAIRSWPEPQRLAIYIDNATGKPVD